MSGPPCRSTIVFPIRKSDELANSAIQISQPIFGCTDLFHLYVNIQFLDQCFATLSLQNNEEIAFINEIIGRNSDDSATMSE